MLHEGVGMFGGYSDWVIEVMRGRRKGGNTVEMGDALCSTLMRLSRSVCQVDSPCPPANSWLTISHLGMIKDKVCKLVSFLQVGTISIPFLRSIVH